MSLYWRALRVLSAALAFALLALPSASSAKAKEYDGADAGYLVYSVGTVRIGMHFAFSYRRLSTLDGAPAEDWRGKIEPKLGGAIYLKVRDPDFTGEETGHVVVTRLPPGRYAVNNFAFAGMAPMGGSVRWSPAKPFALPFSIRSREATYIGSFMRAPSLGTRLKPILGAAGYFVVADRADRDLPIAATRLPAGVIPKAEVTDVSQFGSQVLRTAQP
jgi:hypothetical protein